MSATSAYSVSRKPKRRKVWDPLRMTAEERQRLNAACKGDGTSMREQIRMSALAGLHRKRKRRSLLQAAKEGYDFGLTESEIRQMEEAYA